MGRERTDFAMVNYGLPPQAWASVQELDARHLADHPTCEVCKASPSVRITPLGTLRAACLLCCEDIWAEVECDVQRRQAMKEFLDG